MKIVRVFTDTVGDFGNPVGIILDTVNELNTQQRQQIAAASGMSEVVFVNDLAQRSISIYTPQREIPFAGHAAVGVAYFLSQKPGEVVTELQGSKGGIKTWHEQDLTWVRSELAIAPPWNFEQLPTALAVEEIVQELTAVKKHTLVWAWLDESKSLIRARTFAPDWGIPEDEANGSGCMVLATHLNRNLTVRHGKGSVVHARPSIDGFGEVGGRVKLD